MKAWYQILAGWLTLITGHAIMVAVRARIHAAYFGTGKEIPLPEPTFYLTDGAIVGIALLLITVGTFRILNRPRWKLSLAALVTALQFLAAYWAWLTLSFAVHLGVGGPI